MPVMRFPNGLRKALTLSYDDGVEQDRQLIGILDAAGLKCTFNLNSGCFPPEGHVWPEGQIHRRMPASAVQALYKGEHEVAVHTLTHPDLTQLPLSEMVRELTEDRLNLEKMFGTLVRGAAYPYGTYSDQTVEALRASGLVYCRTVWSSHDFSIPQDWLRELGRGRRPARPTRWPGRRGGRRDGSGGRCRGSAAGARCRRRGGGRRRTGRRRRPRRRAAGGQAAGASA